MVMGSPLSFGQTTNAEGLKEVRLSCGYGYETVTRGDTATRKQSEAVHPRPVRFVGRALIREFFNGSARAWLPSYG